MSPLRSTRPTPKADFPAQGPTRRPFSRTGGAALLAVALLAALALALPSAWRETQRREAYLPQLEQQAARTPDDGPLLALVGAGRMAAGENAGAADAFRQATADGESNEAVWQALAANVAATGDRARAIADLRLGIKALPLSTGLQGALAQARISEPNAPPALAAAIDPQGPAPLRERYAAGSRLNGLAGWWGRRHPGQSGFATRQAWALERPNDALAQRLWGEALLRNRRVSEAGAALAHALSLAPQSPDANLAVAQYLAQSGEMSKAALQYIACLKLRPNWLPALLGFGEASLKNGLVPYATRAYTRATEVAPQSANPWIGLGKTRLRRGVDFNQAVAAFKNAARLAPARTDYFDDYADALRRSSHAPEAEALLHRRLHSAPDDALAHYLLGLILRDTDPTPARAAEAEAQVREALRLSPHNPMADILLGQILRDKGQAAEALRLFHEALAQTPYDQKLQLIVARTAQQVGRTAEAAQMAARAKALYAAQQRAAVLADQARRTPMDPAVHQSLAALYAWSGQPEKARQEADMAHLLQTDPEQAALQMNKLDAMVQAALSK